VLGMRVDGTSHEQAATEILGWASRGESRYVCIATVNNVIEAHDDPASIAWFVLQLTRRGRAAVPARLGMS
jgi:UDP-N-acetyl-D-mannosaminuronic acid transferase (WecB/TagA/CpsF family)